MHMLPATREAILKTFPIEGLGIRLSADQLGTFGIGIEFGFGVGTIEGHMSRNQGNDLPSMAFVGTTASPDTGALFKAKRKVRHVVMDERFPYQPVRNFFFREGESYLHMLGRLNDAADDPSTKALLIEIDWIPFSFAQIEEILSTLDKARANGKKVVAYIDQDAGNPGLHARERRGPHHHEPSPAAHARWTLCGASCTSERPSTSSVSSPSSRSAPSTKLRRKPSPIRARQRLSGAGQRAAGRPLWPPGRQNR